MSVMNISAETYTFRSTYLVIPVSVRASKKKVWSELLKLHQVSRQTNLLINFELRRISYGSDDPGGSFPELDEFKTVQQLTASTI